MNIRIIAVSITALAIMATAANALSVVNTDNTAYTIKVTPKGGKAMNLALKPNASANVDCKAGCQLALNGKTQDVDGKAVKIWIKAGVFAVK